MTRVVLCDWFIIHYEPCPYCRRDAISCLAITSHKRQAGGGSLFLEGTRQLQPLQLYEVRSQSPSPSIGQEQGAGQIYCLLAFSKHSHYYSGPIVKFMLCQGL